MSNEGMAILLVIIGFIITGVAGFISGFTLMYEGMLTVIYMLTGLKNRSEVNDAFSKDIRNLTKYVTDEEARIVAKHGAMAIVIPILVVIAALGVVIKALTVVL